MNASLSSFDRVPADARRPLLRLRAALRSFFLEICEKASTLRYLEDAGGF
jgi:hypothetical protein